MPELFFPTVSSPVYQGARIVAVEGGVAGYEAEVYVNYQPGDAPAGRGRFAPLDTARVSLNRTLKEGDELVAVQLGGDPGNAVLTVVTVGKVPPGLLQNGEKFRVPVVATPLYRCQRGFWVNEVVQGVQITSTTGTSQMQEQTPWGRGWVWVPAPGLQAGQEIRAKQAFPDSPFPQPSDYLPQGQGVPVEEPPALDDDRFQPEVVKEWVSIGTTVLKVCNILPGAKVRIYAEGKAGQPAIEYGVRVAGGGCSFIDLDRPLAHENPLAEQWLCDDQPKSLPSEPVTIKQAMGTPKIEPICVGSTVVHVVGTEVGALVEVQATGGQHNAVTATGPRTAIDLSPALQDGNEVQVRQSNDIEKGAWTPTPAVRVGNPAATTSVLNDDKPDVPVFYLGQTVRFRAIDCQNAKEKAGRIVHVIHLRTGTQTGLPLTETSTGYFEATWPIPLQAQAGGAPAGKYTARFEIPGSQPNEIGFSVVGLTVGDTRDILKVHNKWRRDAKKYPNIKAPADLTWSDNLAAEAQEWANTLANEKHSLEHVGGVPENLAEASPGWGTPAQMAELWITGDGPNHKGPEKDLFKPPCDQWGDNCSATGSWKDIGHYTQVVWAANKEVGCGLARDTNLTYDYLVGRYNSGNVQGQPVFG